VEHLASRPKSGQAFRYVRPEKHLQKAISRYYTPTRHLQLSITSPEQASSLRYTGSYHDFRNQQAKPLFGTPTPSGGKAQTTVPGHRTRSGTDIRPISPSPTPRHRTSHPSRTTQPQPGFVARNTVSCGSGSPSLSIPHSQLGKSEASEWWDKHSPQV
jgi:hypothetical protein